MLRPRVLSPCEKPIAVWFRPPWPCSTLTSVVISSLPNSSHQGQRVGVLGIDRWRADIRERQLESMQRKCVVVVITSRRSRGALS